MNFLAIEQFNRYSVSWRRRQRVKLVRKILQIVLLVVPMVLIAAWLVVRFGGELPVQAAVAGFDFVKNITQ